MRKIIALAPAALAAALALSACARHDADNAAAPAGDTLNVAGDAGAVPTDGNAALDQSALGNGGDELGNGSSGNDSGALGNGA